MATSARIEELQKKFDENPRRYFAPLANEYRKVGDVDQAIFICQEYLPQQPGHMSGHIVYGQALFEARRLEEARSVFETALTLDPENLIALRQLGDIARELGDPEGAKGWYQRVLEADPRNEEIAALLSLLATAPAAAPAPAEGNHAETGGAAQVTHATAPTPAEPVVESPLETAPTESPLADFATLVEEVTPVSEGPASRGPSSEFTTPHTATDSGALEWADTEVAFEDDNGATTAGTVSPSTPEAAPPNAAVALELDSMVPGTTPSLSEAATSDLVPVLEGLEATRQVETPAPATGELPQLDELDLVGADAEGASPAATSSRHAASPFVTETMAELYLQQGHRDEALAVYRQLIAERPDDAALRARMDELSAAAEQQEILPSNGELAEQQTHPRQAFADQPSIRDFLTGIALRRPRITQETGAPPVEPADVGAVEVRAESAATTATTADVVSGETAVDFREPPSAPQSSGPIVDTAQQPVDASRSSLSAVTMKAVANSDTGPDASARDVAPAGTEPGHTIPLRRPTPPTGGETVGGSIDALFAGAEAAREDLEAATALAGAFTAAGVSTSDRAESETKKVETPAGRPARPASDELSLDRVFKEPTPSRGRDAVPGFSFDQFFSDTASVRSSTATPETPGVVQGATEDIEQFNAWLEGLKKS